MPPSVVLFALNRPLLLRQIRPTISSRRTLVIANAGSHGPRSHPTAIINQAIGHRRTVQTPRHRPGGTQNVHSAPPINRFNSTTAAASTSKPATADAPHSPSLLRRIATTATVVFVTFAAGLTMSAAPAADTVNGMLNPPSDAETLTLFVPPTAKAEEVNEYLVSHPLAAKLRATAGMRESRPHLKIPASMRPHNLTAGVLIGDGKVEVPPLNFADNTAELPSLITLSYLGPDLCGHPGIVHGGMLATMLDEGLARACFPALPNKVGVTASLKIDYRVPCPAGSFVVLKAYTTKVEGRKAWVKGWIELLGDSEDGEGTKLVEAEALFIEPRGAKNMARIYSSQS